MRPGQALLLSRPSLVGPPLPANTIEWWDARYGVSLTGSNVNSWTGQKRGVVLPYLSSRPTLAVDAGHFNNQPVVKTQRIDSASGSALQNLSINPALITSGTRPWVFHILRFWSITPTGLHYCHVVTPSGSNGLPELFLSNGVFDNMIAGSPAGNVQASDFSFDQNCHAYAAWMDGLRANLQIDGGLCFALPTTATTSATSTGLTIGAWSSASISSPTSASHAFFLLCASKPSDAEIAALLSWARQVWAVPVPKTLSQWFGSLVKLDFNADVGVTHSSNRISAWDGGRADGYALRQATPANQPLLVPNALDGHAMVRFTAANNERLVQLAADTPNFAAYTLDQRPRFYLVSGSTAGFLFDIAMDHSSTGTNTALFSNATQHATHYKNLRYNTSAAINPSTTLEPTIWSLYDHASVDRSYLARNAGAPSPSLAGSSVAGMLQPIVMRMGSRTDNLGPLDGNIARMVILCAGGTSAISDDYQSHMMAYLRGMYPSTGLTVA